MPALTPSRFVAILVFVASCIVTYLLPITTAPSFSPASHPGRQPRAHQEVKRADPQPADDKTWDRDVGRGCKLQGLMEGSIQGADQILGYDSQVDWTYNDLEKWGWSWDDTTMEGDTFADKLENFEDAVDGLGLSKELSGDGGPNYEINQAHDEEVEVDGIEYPDTRGYYKTGFNIDSGVIYRIDNHSPSSMGIKPVPDLKMWAEVVYLAWNKLSGKDVSAVNYMFATSISNPESKSIAARALGGFNNIDQWPGTSFSASDTDPTGFQALLGCPNGQGIPWFLIRHKSGPTQRTVTKITLFSQNPGSLHMLFNLGDASAP
ncbi:MAG: hypothetical protein M1820_008309 [Bogoriella megaspora]|nr:MAG: hypothetical protein M1820_008309 [Bogoriella megaspora]